MPNTFDLWGDMETNTAVLRLREQTKAVNWMLVFYAESTGTVT